MRLPLALLQVAGPAPFCRLAARTEPWLAWPALVLALAGTAGGLVLAPADYLQGEGYRIIFVHVPAAWLSMLIYVVMAGWAVLVLVWRSKVAAALLVAAAPVGAAFTALTLATGSLWGKPMWGTWWAWDARLTSELILLFLYLGFIGLQQALPPGRETRRAGALLVVVGVVNIPIIHFSVDWWHTLHQPATITRLDTPAIATSMLVPLLLMAGAGMLHSAATILARARAELLLAEPHTRWAREAAGG